MAENRIKFNVLSQVRLIFRVAFLRRELKFLIKEESLVSTSSVAVRQRQERNKACGESTIVHPIAKFNASRSVLVGAVLENENPKKFRGYFRSNLYFTMFTLLFFTWLVPMALLLPIFAIGAILNLSEHAMTLLICAVGSVIILAVVNFMRFQAESILEEEEAFLVEQQPHQSYP